MWGSPYDWVPLEFDSQTFPHQGSSNSSVIGYGFLNYSLCFPTPIMVTMELSAQVSCDFLYLAVGLFNLGGSSLSCDLIFLMDLRRAVDSLVCSVFYLSS